MFAYDRSKIRKKGVELQWVPAHFRHMPRFHIHLRNDVDVVDEEGADFADLASAKAMAIDGARDVMGEHVRAGRPVNLSHRIEIADDRGCILAFRELLTVIDDQPVES